MPIKSFVAQPTTCRECGRNIQGINRGVVCPSCRMPVCRIHQLGQPNFICHFCRNNQQQFHAQFPQAPAAQPNPNVMADGVIENLRKAETLYREKRTAEADEIIAQTIYDLFLNEEK